MKKDNIRDYATEAFRLYAALGKPSYDDIKEKIYQYALREERKAEVKGGGISKPTEQSLINAQRAVDEFEATLSDILAVENTLKMLSLRDNGMEIKKAVEIVYFTEPKRPIRKNEISERVHMAEIAIPTTEPTVYRYLKIARNIFGIERKLRNCKVDSSRFNIYDIMQVSEV